DYYITINTAVKPLDDVNVRRAMAYALDKEAIAYAARGDYATVSTSSLAEAFFPFWHNPNAPQYDYSVATANELLDAGGYIDIDGDGIREVTQIVTKTDTQTETETETGTETATVTSETGDGPGFEFYLILASMLVAIPLIRKKK
ncbi:MAG: ABC transporter substrate-binding protein, partial [Promethearchaeota archaeon]